MVPLAVVLILHVLVHAEALSRYIILRLIFIARNKLLELLRVDQWIAVSITVEDTLSGLLELCSLANIRRQRASSHVLKINFLAARRPEEVPERRVTQVSGVEG